MYIWYLYVLCIYMYSMVLPARCMYLLCIVCIYVLVHMYTNTYSVYIACVYHYMYVPTVCIYCIRCILSVQYTHRSSREAYKTVICHEHFEHSINCLDAVSRR